MQRLLQGAAAALVLGPSGHLMAVSSKEYVKEMGSVMRLAAVPKGQRKQISRVLRLEPKPVPNSVVINRRSVNAPRIRESDTVMILELIEEMRERILEEKDAKKRFVMAGTLCSLMGEQEHDNSDPTSSFKPRLVQRAG